MAQTKNKNSIRRDGSLFREFADLVSTLKHMFDGYHPERHYMRGPGPAWRAKHAAS